MHHQRPLAAQALVVKIPWEASPSVAAWAAVQGAGASRLLAVLVKQG